MKYLITGLVFLVASCGALTRPKEYPCSSPRWHSCGNGYCCPEGFDCGGTPEFPGCPAGACCSNGGEP